MKLIEPAGWLVETVGWGRGRGPGPGPEPGPFWLLAMIFGLWRRSEEWAPFRPQNAVKLFSFAA